MEDDPNVREVTRRALSAGGYEVVVAKGSAEALEMVARDTGPLSLLITDVVMPGLRGPALAERLRRLRPGLRVLYITGYAEYALSLDGAMEAGAALLLKPFTAASLQARVRAVLDRA